VSALQRIEALHTHIRGRKPSGLAPTRPLPPARRLARPSGPAAELRRSLQPATAKRATRTRGAARAALSRGIPTRHELPRALSLRPMPSMAVCRCRTPVGPPQGTQMVAAARRVVWPRALRQTIRRIDLRAHLLRRHRPSKRPLRYSRVNIHVLLARRARRRRCGRSLTGRTACECTRRHMSAPAHSGRTSSAIGFFGWLSRWL
jgi:hypothetical protein